MKWICDVALGAALAFLVSLGAAQNILGLS